MQFLFVIGQLKNSSLKQSGQINGNFAGNIYGRLCIKFLHLIYSLRLNIFYLLFKCAKRTRHKLNKLMKSSSIYNKLQHYLIEHACIWIFLTLIYVNWTKTENEERNEREGSWWWWCVRLFSLWTTRQQETFKTS